MMRSIFLCLFLCMVRGVAVAQLSLEEYREAVALYSHTLLAADIAIEGADATRTLTRKGYLPTLDFGRDFSLTFRGGEGERSWTWSTRPAISQNVYSGGHVRTAVKQAELGYNIAELNAEAESLAVLYEAESAYWSLSRAEIYHRAMSDYLNIVRSLRDVVAKRYNEGYISKSDLLQVESRLSDAEYQLSSAKQRYDVSLHRFNILRGADPTTAVTLTHSILDTLPMPRREDMDEILLRVPHYRASELNVERQHLGAKSAQAAFLPQIDVGLYGLLEPKRPHVKGGGLMLDGGVLISFNTPIFHFGERRAAVRVARSEAQRAEQAHENLRDDISLDESDGWTNLQLTRTRVDATRRNLELARENLDISTYSYHEGMATILDVLQAQISWLQIFENAIAALYDYAMAISSYNYIVGGER